MEIQSPELTKDVVDYDFSFTSGLRSVTTVDPSVGDYVEELVDRYQIHLASKPSFTNPEEILPEELVTVFKSQLTVFIERKRKQRMPSPEELFSMRKTFETWAKGPQSLQ